MAAEANSQLGTDIIVDEAKIRKRNYLKYQKFTIFITVN